MVAREFGEVNVRRLENEIEIRFTILMEPEGDQAEGWQTGVALDASASMKAWYGRGLQGKVPAEVVADYARRGWLQALTIDGQQVKRFTPLAYEDARARGFLQKTENAVEPLARQFISYLADHLDEDGGTTLVYWACDEGDGFEVVGDFTAEQCRSLRVAGPEQHACGKGTRLLPALRYFVDRFHDARRGMYLFLTDGRLDDLDEIKRYTADVCRAIAAGKRNPVKCVLIGVGERIDERQMEELDDLETGTGVDLWDHKMAREMRDVVEIFAEVVSENQIVAPTARLYDASGALVEDFSDGLPALVSFRMPATSSWFELEVGGERVRQSVVLPG